VEEPFMPRQHKRREEKAQAAASRETPKEAKLKGKGPPEYPDLVLLAHATNLAEAELFKVELEAHGIPAILEGEGAPIAVTPGAGVPVLVPEEFADQAAELIAELESAKPEGNPLADKEDLFDEEDELDEDVDDGIKDIDKEEDLDDSELDDDDLDEEEDVEDDADDEEWEEDEEEDEEEWEEDDEDDEDDDDEEWGDDDDR
jgi:hypothetical protein